MATDAPITGVHRRAPLPIGTDSNQNTSNVLSDALKSASARELAQSIQMDVNRLRSLVAALDDVVDTMSCPVSPATIRDSLGRAVDYIHLHQEIVPRVLAMAERIEVIGVGEG